MFSCCQISITALILISGITFQILLTLDAFKKIEWKNDKQCTLLHSDIDAVEDIVPITPLIGIGGSNNNRKLWMTTDPNPPLGGLHLFFYDDKDDTLRREEVKLVNVPAGLHFHPHGLHVGQEDGSPINDIKTDSIYVWVINHGYVHGGEAIVMFKLDVEKRVATFVRAIRNKYFDTIAYGGLNDVVVTSKGRLIVTQWLPHPSPPKGPMHFENFQQRFQKMIAIPKALLVTPEGTNVFGCEYSDDVSKEAVCTIAVSTLAIPNGISRDRSGAYAGIVELLGKRFVVVDSATYAEVARVQLPHAMDNVNFVSQLSNATHSVWSGASILSLMAAAQVEHDENAKTPSGTILITFNHETKTFTYEDVVCTDGSGLQGIASSWAVGPKEKLRHAHGSYVRSGILFCKT